ncbi:MAG: type II secretion system F family protein [Candidatus Colwellbacteria bacterium]|nr:type II secretion system F family protein [Candidatus Colwellbacteria bacterium]
MLFTYEAFNVNGQTVRGEIDAKSEKDVVLYLEGRGLIPSRVHPKHKAEKKGVLSTQFFAKISETDKIFLVRNLATAIKAGLSLNDALEIVLQDTKKGLMRDVLTHVRDSVREGHTLSDSFMPYKDLFPGIFIGLLRAGESGSQLDKVLEELSRHMVKEYSLIKKIKSAMVYPILLLTVGFAVVVFLLTFVLPRLTGTFQLSGVELPLITRVLVVISDTLSGNPIVTTLVFLGLTSGIFLGARTRAGKKIRNKIFMKTPVVNDLIRKVALVRFTRTLGSLITGATPILEALQTSAGAVANDEYKEAILDSAGKVQVGVTLSKAMKNYPELFPLLLTNLVAVGEKTGSLEYVLATFSNFYEEEVDTKLKDLTTLFEPILLMIMGLIVGGIAVAVLLPIYQLVGRFT